VYAKQSSRLLSLFQLPCRKLILLNLPDPIRIVHCHRSQRPELFLVLCLTPHDIQILVRIFFIMVDQHVTFVLDLDAQPLGVQEALSQEVLDMLVLAQPLDDGYGVVCCGDQAIVVNAFDLLTNPDVDFVWV
jgi:hypothetical protein